MLTCVVEVLQKPTGPPSKAPPGLPYHRWPLKSTAGRRLVAPRAPCSDPPEPLPWLAGARLAPEANARLSGGFDRCCTWPAGTKCYKVQHESQREQGIHCKRLEVGGIEASNIMTAVSVEMEEIEAC